jgi:hypothetical protein
MSKKMKKVFYGILLLTVMGCAEKTEYEQTVLEQMQMDKDIKDYKIEPEMMAKCVIHTSTDKMPGLFAYDPERLKAYKNYTKMINLNNSSDPKKLLEELRTDFGSPKELATAHSIYTESVVQCMEGLVTSEERDMKTPKNK